MHGRETGIIKRLPSGEFIEVHAPISAGERFTLMARQSYLPVVAGEATDTAGIHSSAPAEEVPAQLPPRS